MIGSKPTMPGPKATDTTGARNNPKGQSAPPLTHVRCLQRRRSGPGFGENGRPAFGRPGWRAAVRQIKLSVARDPTWPPASQPRNSPANDSSASGGLAFASIPGILRIRARTPPKIQGCPLPGPTTLATGRLSPAARAAWPCPTPYVRCPPQSLYLPACRL